MNLVIDFGNSSAKIGIFDNGMLKESRVLTNAESLEEFLINFSADHLIVSSVNIDPKLILSWAKHISSSYILDYKLPLPVKNGYATPATLGVDRIAAVCGAQALFPNRNCLVIDAGTCITYDFIDAQSVYHGGSISPGVKMRFQAMHTFTARLPLGQVVDHPKFIGDTTASCLQSGVIFGVTEEVEGFIRRYQQKFEALQVILCGGDTRFFENKLKASIFAIPELVLSGLNSILEYNVNR
jgi:type III pantothenate kinase